MINAGEVRKYEKLCASLNGTVVPKLKRVTGGDPVLLPVVSEFRVSLSAAIETLGAPKHRGRSYYWNFERPDGVIYTARALETGRDEITLRLCAKDGSGIDFYIFVADAFSASR